MAGQLKIVIFFNLLGLVDIQCLLYWGENFSECKVPSTNREFAQEEQPFWTRMGLAWNVYIWQRWAFILAIHQPSLSFSFMMMVNMDKTMGKRQWMKDGEVKDGMSKDDF
jgi:hypothetical protein